MKCLICGNNEFDLIHKGTRDIPSINVLKCRNCGLVCNDEIRYNSEKMYADGGMLINTYNAYTDKMENLSFGEWRSDTYQSDYQRFSKIKNICQGKRILEFGCGNGGLLRMLKNVTTEVTGIELYDDARAHLEAEGIKTFKYLSDVDEKYDVVISFMVLEHLNEPDNILRQLHHIMKPNGRLICDTPNAEDALLSLYQSEAFADFTYWSEHVYLYSSNTIRHLMERNGFKTIENTQYMRYDICNHLYWLSRKSPAGHLKWKDQFDDILKKAYSDNLVKQGIADTLWYVGENA